MDFIETLERIPNIRTLETPGVYLKQRLAKTAQELSLRGEAQAHVEIVNEALCKVTELLYQADTDNSFANVDNRTFRILVPLAWGSDGFKMWGIRQWEADVLRAILITRSTAQDAKRPALFDFGTVSRRWFLNVSDYGSYDLALRFLQREPVTLATWRLFSAQWHDKHTAAMLRYRQRPHSKHTTRLHSA